MMCIKTGSLRVKEGQPLHCPDCFRRNLGLMALFKVKGLSMSISARRCTGIWAGRQSIDSSPAAILSIFRRSPGTFVNLTEVARAYQWHANFSRKIGPATSGGRNERRIHLHSRQLRTEIKERKRRYPEKRWRWTSHARNGHAWGTHTTTRATRESSSERFVLTRWKSQSARARNGKIYGNAPRTRNEQVLKGVKYRAGHCCKER